MAKPKQTKTEIVRAMLARPNGATISAICKSTGWQAHSARAALSGFRKAGYVVDRSTAKDGTVSIYRITAAPEATN